MKKVLAVLLVLVVAVGAFLYFPRGGVIEAVNAAVLAILNAGVDAQRSGQPDFGPALDGDVFANGDVVRADEKGRAVLTFFDGSTLAVEPKSRVRVVALSRTGSGGIDVTIEQTLGRTWASVSKLATADSKFILRTPSMVATVRGTAWETIVEQLPDGKTVTTVKGSEGELLVQAVAGGEVTVRPNQEVAVQQDQRVEQQQVRVQPPTPKLRFSGPAGVGFVVINPNGNRCGATGGAIERLIPRCEVLAGAGQSVVIGEVVPGTYTLMLVAAQAVQDAAIVAEGLGVQATDFTQRFSRPLALGDLVRTTIPVTVGADGKLGSTGFTPAELVSSVCGAEAVGRVFSSGKVTERGDLLLRYGKEAKGQPAAVVVTGEEMTAVAEENVKNANLPVTASNVAVTVDGAGMHFKASVAAGPLNVPIRADIIAGALDGKLLVKLRNLDAGILPQPAKEQITKTIEQGLSEFGSTFPLVVQRVAFRSGCMAIIGRTPS